MMLDYVCYDLRLSSFATTHDRIFGVYYRNELQPVIRSFANADNVTSIQYYKPFITSDDEEIQIVVLSTFTQLVPKLHYLNVTQNC